MTIRRDADPSSAPCCATAAYLYALTLDASALAWEFLRRHAGYRAAWREALPARRDAAARHWGLRCRP